MSNVYDFDFLREYDRQAAARALDSVESTPQDAAEQIKVGKIGQVPPETVDKEYTKTLKGVVAANVVQNNQHIIDYVNSHPLAAKVSGNDFHNLDAVSKNIDRIDHFWSGSPTPGAKPTMAAIQRFREAWGPDILGSDETKKLFSDADMLRAYPMLHTSALAGIVGLQGLGRFFGAVPHFVGGYVEEQMRSLTGDENIAKRAGREAASIAEFKLNDMAGHGLHPGEMPKAEFDLRFGKAFRELNDTAPFIRDNKAPPPGISEIIDDLRARESKVENKNHDDLSSSVEKSETKELVPELMEDFIRLRTKQTMSVSVEKLQELYGDKEPTPGDGLIGDITGAQQAYRFGQRSGFVDIPLEEWNVRVPKEAKEALKDDKKFSADGISNKEQEELKEWWKLQEQYEPKMAPMAESSFAEDFDITPEQAADLEKRLGQAKWRRLQEERAATKGQIPSERYVSETVKGAFETLKKIRAEAPLPLKQVRRQAGIPAGRDYPKEPQFSIDLQSPGKTVKLGGGSFDVIGSTTAGKALEETMRDQRPGGILDPLRQAISKYVKDVPIHILKDKDVGRSRADKLPGVAYYDAIRHAIIVSESMWNDPVGAHQMILHESVHAATTRALNIKGTEPVKLFAAALAREDPSLLETYGFKDAHEFLAEAMSNYKFQQRLANFEVSDKIAKLYGLEKWKGNNLWTTFLNWVRDALGLSKDYHSALDVALKLTEDYAELQKRVTPRELHRFELWASKREVTAPAAPPVEKEKPERISGVPAITEKYWRRLVAKEYEDAQAAQAKKEIENAKRKVSAEWKANSKEVRREVADKIVNHPTPQAAEFLRDGIYAGQLVKPRPRLDAKLLTPEQKAMLPKDMYVTGREGYAPDEVAGMFGFSSGDEMIQHVSNYEKDRGKMRPDNYINMLIDRETERQMQLRYGDKAERALLEAQSHILGDNSLSLRAAEAKYLAQMAGVDVPYTKEQMQRIAHEDFKGIRAEMAAKVKETLINEAGKYGRKVELAFAKGNASEALRMHMQQQWALHYARAAKDFEENYVAKLETFKQRYSKRTPAGVPVDNTNFIQQLMNRLGMEVRDPRDLATEMGMRKFKSLEEFVKDRTSEDVGQVMPVPEFLFDPNWNKTLDKVSVEEYTGIVEAIQTIDHNGREEHKAWVGEQRVNFDTLVDRLTDEISSFPEKALQKEDVPRSDIRKLVKGYFQSLLTMETLSNKFSRNNPRGIHNQAIVRAYTEAEHEFGRHSRALAKMINDLVPMKEQHKKIDNMFFKHPETGNPMSFSRSNALAILQNMGNEGNAYGLLDGYKIPRSYLPMIQEWLWRHVTEEDFARAQKLGRIFSYANELSNRMYRDVSGVAPQEIETWKIQTPWGEKEGWYHPIIYDTNLPQKNIKLQSGGDIFDYPVWTKSNLPAAGYTRSRTGYVGPYKIDDGAWEIAFSRLQQVARNAAFRPALIQLQKIFKDQRFRTALRLHQGENYPEMYDNFLKDIAGNNTQYTSNQAVVLKAINFFRQNIISHAVALNLSTWGKHNFTAIAQSIYEVGVKDYMESMRTLFHESPVQGENNWQWGMRVSGELGQRHNFFFDTIKGSGEHVFGNMKSSIDLATTFADRSMMEGIRLLGGDLKGKYIGMRESLMWMEAAPLAYADLWSAQITFHATYRRALREGKSYEDALFEGNRAVRRSHGSAALTNRPEILRSNPWVMSFLSFYTVFNHILNRQYEMAWAARASMRGEGYYVGPPRRSEGELAPPIIIDAKKRGDVYVVEDYKGTKQYKTGKAMIPVIAGMFVAYHIAPSFFEDLVEPLHKHDPDQRYSLLDWARVFLRGETSSWPVLRDVGHAVISGGDVGSAGLFSNLGRRLLPTIEEAINPTKRWTTERKQRYIKDANMIWSSMSGAVIPAAPVRMGIFGYNWYTGRDHPLQGSMNPFGHKDTVYRKLWRGVTTGSSEVKHR